MKKIYLILSLVFLGSVTASAQGSTCATAVALTGSGYYNADGPLVGTPSGGNIAGCGIFGGTNADWYEFTPTCDGVMSITNNVPANPNNGIRLTVRSGSCSALNCVANSGWQDGTVNNIAVTGGTTYYIEFDDSWNGVNSGVPFDWELDYTVNNAPTPGVLPQLTSAFVTWIPFGLETGWDIEWGPSGFVLGSGNTTNVDSIEPGNQYQITTYNGAPLIPETEYCYYISIENTGCWIGPICFTTLPVCQAPTALMSNPLSTSSILSWQPGGSPGSGSPTWDLQYGPLGTPINDPSMIFAGNVASSAYNAQSLPTCTDFHMYVREICDATTTPQEISAWVGPFIMSTACNCDDPSALGGTPDANDPFNYDIDWTVGNIETAWNVQWGPSGFLIGTGTIVNANTNPFTLQGVTPDSQLDYYVQAECGTDGTSNWVGPFTFTTNVFCPVPTGLGVNNVETNQADIFWNVSGTT
ncbi:MAG: hypothetical protein AB8B72_08050, partial [Crocinitomicaceae bacterium]